MGGISRPRLALKSWCGVQKLDMSLHGEYTGLDQNLKLIRLRYTNLEGAISGLAFSPTSNLIAFTSLDGSFHRWTSPVPADLPSPIATEAQQAKKLDRLLDDEFGDDEDMEERGEDLVEDLADDWIVDDDGGYGADDGEKAWGKGRTEVGESEVQFQLGVI